MNSSRGVLAGAAFFPRWGAASAGVETTVVLPSVLAGLCLMASAGNLLLLAVLVDEARRGRSSPCKALLLNVCAADLILALYCLPARIAAYARRSWPLGGFLCRATDWLLQGCLVAKSLTWAAVGQAHLRHLRAPPSQCRAWAGRRLAGLLASAWLAALLLPLPLLLFTRLDGGGAQGPGLDCVFRAPAFASDFMDVFNKVYLLLAYLAPSAFTWACFARALRLQRGRKRRLAKPAAQSQKVTRVLLCLGLLFQATWLPEWVVWLWERHGPPGGRPPPALVFLAEVLLFLDGSCNPGVFVASSSEFREGLRSLWAGLNCGRGKEGSAGAVAGETPQALHDLQGEAAAAKKVLPDVEHFWKGRRNAAAGEESDPVPWEHLCDP